MKEIEEKHTAVGCEATNVPAGDPVEIEKCQVCVLDDVTYARCSDILYFV